MAASNKSDMGPETLKNLRLIDDRVVSKLNCSLVTDSFQNKVDPKNACKEFYNELLEAHRSRDQLIKSCVKDVSSKVHHLQNLKSKNGGDIDSKILPVLRKEQKLLRQMQQELNIEEIIQDQSLKIFKERCRLLYTPPELQEKITS
ncbi:hypothetical protein HELRODRAFT_183359 [Helobdella robusta]|uniref:Protein MIX23 n=1 Tax=Helobdella robusta TaxID=6412 RepID=T1FJI3_HELRO|nr:hypothetical protein HELRODRAFT_183359 [Helobdella robusta]ESO11256.1 hypothetical protein HELRODRAFT_183359 [Helobdella robusta]